MPVQEKTQDNPIQFSADARTLLARHATSVRAERRFWDDWRAMLDAAADTAQKAGFLTNVEGGGESRYGMLQIARPDWPKPLNGGIHLEVFLCPELIRTGMATIYLDVEDVVGPEKLGLIRKIRRLLARYENSGLLMSTTGFHVTPGESYRILERTLPLAGVSATKVAEALLGSQDVASVIDEARALPNVETLWSTDFLPLDPRPELAYGGSTGGLRFQQGGGRLGSDCVVVDGTAKGNHSVVDSRPTHIITLEHTHKIQNDDEICLSCVVKSPKGGRIWFYGEGHLDTPGEAREFPPVLEKPHWPVIEVPRTRSWHVIVHRTRVTNPGDYGFADKGAYVYVRIQTEDTGFLIGSMAFGRCT